MLLELRGHTGAAMARYAVTHVEQPDWVEVTSSRPCPVCGAVSECALLENAEFAHCLRQVSEWPLLDRGWLHRLTDARSEAAALTLV